MPVALVDYSAAIAECQRLARRNVPAAVSFGGTGNVAHARRDPGFAETLRSFDLVLPDGMPVVWSLNSQGANLKDRVHAPEFLERLIASTPSPWRHFFLGGNGDALRAFVDGLKKECPGLEIAGILPTPPGGWRDKDEASFAAAIAESGADFIWATPGGERPEEWIARNLHRHQRGVFIAAGSAIPFPTGERLPSPAWMQRSGTAWALRLLQEPLRFWRRDIASNALFLFYTCRDAVLGTPTPKEKKPPTGLPSVAFLGSRGVPARYSGFEVVVEELGSRLAALGHPVTVYNRLPRFEHTEKSWKGMDIVGLYTIPTKSLDTIVHTFLSMLHAIWRRYDIIYLCGVGNAVLARLAKAAGMRVVINVDGADFRRKKWGGFARWWLKKSEHWAMEFGDSVIADNATVADRYLHDYGKRPEHLSYGLTVRDTPVHCGELEKWGLRPNEYFLYVSRLTPENEAELLLRAYRLLENPLPLVLVGADPYEHAYRRLLGELATDRVIFTGLRFADAYIELSQNARAFVMPATIEATRLVLLDQLGMGKCVVYHDCAATREVLGDTGIPFDTEKPIENLAAKLRWAQENPGPVAAESRRIRERAELFRWETVLARYEQIFAGIVEG
jgi:exopolysaccharide biosynthesis WecB/TagA/CpsF family protein